MGGPRGRPTAVTEAPQWLKINVVRASPKKMGGQLAVSITHDTIMLASHRRLHDPYLFRHSHDMGRCHYPK